MPAATSAEAAVVLAHRRRSAQCCCRWCARRFARRAADTLGLSVLRGDRFVAAAVSWSRGTAGTAPRDPACPAAYVTWPALTPRAGVCVLESKACYALGPAVDSRGAHRLAGRDGRNPRVRAGGGRRAGGCGGVCHDARDGGCVLEAGHKCSSGSIAAAHTRSASKARLSAQANGAQQIKSDRVQCGRVKWPGSELRTRALPRRWAVTVAARRPASSSARPAHSQ